MLLATTLHGMEVDDGRTEIIPIQMRIDLCGSDRLMTEHFLHGPQVGSSLHQMSGKTVPEGMRAHILSEAGFVAQGFDDVEYGNPANSPPWSIEEYQILESPFHVSLSAVVIKEGL
jgi:hypothetical protein